MPVTYNQQQLSKRRRDPRILLCRLYCGLADAFNQIEKCWRYAEGHDRILVIDTRESGLLGDFSDFFQPRIKNSRIHFDPSSGVDAFPELLSPWCDRSTLALQADRGLGACQRPVASSTTRHDRSTFDFRKNHPEPVILHESGGGGKLAYHLLDRLKLSPGILDEVFAKLANLPKNYVAVHVRNTDYQTDYKALFGRIRPQVSGENLLVCSDDANVISYANSFFTDSRVFQSSEIPITHGLPLHDPSTFSDPISRRAATANAILDLLALGRAKHVFITRHAKGQTSGYSKLARHLCDNKYVIDQVLGLASDRQPLLPWQHKRWWHEFRRRLDRWVA